MDYKKRLDICLQGDGKIHKPFFSIKIYTLGIPYGSSNGYLIHTSLDLHHSTKASYIFHPIP